MKTVDDFKVGDYVRFIPTGSTGVVTKKNLTFVFVKFSVMAGKGLACDPNDLEKL